jgi:NAD+ diphosphatase
MPLSEITSFFTGNPLDRADILRTHPEILGDMLTDDKARILLSLDGEILSDEFGDISWLTYRQCKYLPKETVIFLGLDDGEARYAAALSGGPEDFMNLFPNAKFRDARALAYKAGYAAPMLGIVAQAKSMLSWHESHRFCAKCGNESQSARAGYERLCPSCGASHFPRTDPVVIMLPVHEGQVLLGHNPKFPAGFYSALAGFMEPGETIEEAVARELHEEAGVTATKVKVVANQPWPWPSSLMIGCIAEVTDRELTLDQTEIDDARWISRAEAKAVLNGENQEFSLPPAVAIAHDLVKYWVEND